MSPDLFDLFAARQARDEGMAQVTDHNPDFKAQFMAAIIALPFGWTGICEDIRRDWKGDQPGHPNAWGACWNAAKRQGLLVELPAPYVPTTARKSHARKTPLYQRARPQ